MQVTHFKAKSEVDGRTILISESRVIHQVRRLSGTSKRLGRPNYKIVNGDELNQLDDPDVFEALRTKERFRRLA